MTALMWFRNDLRTDDNTALCNALQQYRRVGAIFYATPAQWRQHDMAPVKGEFIWRTLAELRTTLAKLNVPLWVRIVPNYADVAADIAAFAREQQIEAVYANREYPVNEIARDDQVNAALAAQGVPLRTYHDATLLPPGALQTQQGQPFKVFTPFKRALINLIGADTVHCLLPKKAEIWCDAPALPAYPYETSAVPATLWPAGEKAARKQLMAYANERLHAYREQRDFPALDGTSKLSPYLALGVISIRRCIEAALAQNGGQWAGGDEGAQTWISELIWREFYIHVLSAFPHICKYKALRPETDAVMWRYDASEFQRWCEGRTGYPLIDAAMRQLQQTGWMHNRLRMVTAMFLCKYLLIDWRWGERFFMRHLIDGDLAANNGGWQWSASTGTDAAPYFRLLSPLRQAERFDESGAFTQTFVAELRDVDPKYLLKPGDPALLARGYPAPMVDTKFGRERALEAFAALGASPIAEPLSHEITSSLKDKSPQKNKSSQKNKWSTAR